MSKMLTIDPRDVSVPKLHGYMLGAVSPRPIAFASTIDGNGQVNLSPFSFFNAFGANPPILIFSPARRVRDNTTKHTLENVQEVGEVVVNICDYAMAEQMSLASTEYERGVNEFVKAGFTMVDSTKVKPPRVGEAPVAFECIVKETVPLGSEGGAGNLVICEVVLLHVKEEILDQQGHIDPRKIDTIGRMGGNWYVRANDPAIFEIAKPLATHGIGVDAIPESIRNSKILTGNDLGKLGNVEQIPTLEEVKEFSSSKIMQELLDHTGDDPTRIRTALHHLAKEQLEVNHTDLAWKILLQDAG